MKNIISKITLAIVLFTAATSCSSNTYITGTWKKPGTSLKKYNNIYIDVLSSNIPAKQQVENALQQELGANGIKAEKSIDVMPPDYESQNYKNQDAMMGKIKAGNVDGILTVALLNEKDKQRYVPGNYGYNPGFAYGFYNTYWGYYSGRYPLLYDPGYYTTDEIYYIETNLYDANTDQLVWSTQSKTYNPNSISGFLNGYIKSIDKSLISNGLISGTANTSR